MRVVSVDLLGNVTRLAPGRVFYERMGIGLLVAIVLLLSAVTWLRPGYNWDTLAYIATALENRIDDPVQLHAETWRVVENGATAKDVEQLKFDSPYNQHQWENPADFVSQLSMYRVKVAYITAIRMLSPVAGVDKAAILMSILPSLLFGALCLFWLYREKALQGALLLAPALALGDYLHMTTQVTPDMMAALLSVGAIYLLTRQRDIAACTLLFAAVLFRPDSIILVFALLIAAFLFGWRKTPFLLTFAAALTASMIVAKMAGHIGWWAHFYFSCVEPQNSLTNFNPPFSLADMMKGYVNGVMNTLSKSNWAALWLLAMAAWRLLSVSGRDNGTRFHGLMFALAIGAIGKFVSFPLPDDRIYFGFIAGMALLLITNWKPRFDNEGYRVRSS